MILNDQYLLSEDIQWTDQLHKREWTLMIKIQLPQEPIHPSLPQNDTPAEQAKRKQCLKAQQEICILSSDNSLGLPLMKLPIPDEFDFSDLYNAERGIATAPMLANQTIVTTQLDNPYGPFAGLMDYEKLYVTLKAPEVSQEWLSDESFGEQRLSGVNPVMLKRVTALGDLPKNLNQDLLKKKLDSKMNLQDLIKENKLYSVDFTPFLQGIPDGKIGPLQKYVPQAIGLFIWCGRSSEGVDAYSYSQGGALMPLAIQLDLSTGNQKSTSGANTVKIYTPNDEALIWTIAKVLFNVCDSNVHEMSTHLGRAHFAQESFGVVTPRQLAPQHPIYILLTPHTRFLVYNNQQGMEKLVQPGGPVDQLLASTLDGSLTIAKKAAQSWSATETFPESLALRSVENRELLPHYPYRDDGLLIWDCISRYVRNYLDLYYADDQAVMNDYEIQAWAKELAATDEGGGYIKDMPASFKSIAELHRVLSCFIFQNSAGHSAVNYPQYDYLGFAPSAPLAVYSDFRQFLMKEKVSPQEQLTFLMTLLPPQVLSLGQVSITNALAVYHYDKLGDYTHDLVDPLAKQVLYSFTQSLANVEKQIEAANRQRATNYRYLMPSQILNSASI